MPDNRSYDQRRADYLAAIEADRQRSYSRLFTELAADIDPYVFKASKSDDLELVYEDFENHFKDIYIDTARYGLSYREGTLMLFEWLKHRYPFEIEMETVEHTPKWWKFWEQSSKFTRYIIYISKGKIKK